MGSSEGLKESFCEWVMLQHTFVGSLMSSGQMVFFPSLFASIAISLLEKFCDVTFNLVGVVIPVYDWPTISSNLQLINFQTALNC